MALPVVILGDSNTLWPGSYAERTVRAWPAGGTWQGCPNAFAFWWLPGVLAPFACAAQPGDYYGNFVTPTAPLGIAVMLTGGGEANFGFPVEEYRDTLLDLAAAFREDGAKRVIFLSPPHAHVGDDDRNAQLELYHAEWWRLCELGEFECGPDTYALTADRESMLADGIHMTQQTHAVVAEELLWRLPEPHAAVLGFAALGALCVVRTRNGGGE